MSRNRSRFDLLLILLCLYAPVGAPVAFAAPPDPALSASLEAFSDHRDAAMTVRMPGNWRSSTVGRNVTLLREPDRGVRKNIDETTEIKIWTENRIDHADAVSRLRDIASQFDGKLEYLEIDGWPALQRSFEALLPQKVGRGQRLPEEKYILHASTAIAVGSTVVRVEAKIPSNDPAAIGVAHSIGRQVRFLNPGNAAVAETSLRELRQQPRREPTAPVADDGRIEQQRGAEKATSDLRASDAGSEPTAGAVPISDVASEGTAGVTAGLIQNLGNFSEIEAAASTSGQHLIVATNGRSYSTSNDGGATWTTGLSISPAYPANGDPSVGFGQSGDFHFGFIGYPDGTGGAGNDVNGCTNPSWTSTDNGLTFTHTGHASWCQQAPPTCFPDQEHIAVDRWNPSASNQDQLYNVWRNFGSPAANCNLIQLSGLQMQLTCSVDGGALWNNSGPASIVTAGGAPQGTAPVLLSATGDYPRITVGEDGFVYVVYRDGNNIELDKYTSCQNGLTQVAGFPRTVAGGVVPVPCPVAGLDRCNNGNDLRSQTVAVDDLDPSHIFVAYAFNTAAGNEDIVLRDSTDGGLNWGTPVRLNNGFATRRFMPWVCSTCGEAYVGWYDRRRSTVNDNSLTDYYRGSAKNVGGSLVVSTEKRLTSLADSQCGLTPGNWPCSPRSTNDSESCVSQPQLAGTCVDTQGTGTTTDDVATGDRCDFSNCLGGNVDLTPWPVAGCECVAGDGTNIQCQTGGGCPKYGDYNGNACAAGRVVSAWASSVPAAVNSVDSYVTTEIVGCVPQIQVPGDVDFIGGCDSGGTIEGTLNVCNTGKEDLLVDSITSDDTQFAVTTPSSGYPVVISPDFCFPFEVTFDADTANNGTQAAILTVNSNDPVNPALAIDVSASADASEPDIRTTLLNGLNFDDVCIGDIRTVDVTIQNSGGCPLNVTSIASSDANFQVGAVSAFPLVIPAGDTIQVPIEFQPVNGGTTGAKGGNLTIASNDPDTPSLVLALTGNVPAADAVAFIANSGSFGDVCADTLKDLELTIQNNGLCPLSVTAVALSGANPGDFSLPSAFAPVVLESLNSVVMPVRFQPTEFVTASPRTASVDVTNRTAYSSDATVVDSTAVSGVVPPPDINVPANTGLDPEVEFGNVCAGAVAEKEIPVCNTGLCTLNVTGATLSDGAAGACDDFTIVQNPFPSEVSHDFCMSVVVRYTPTEEGEHSCVLTITSDDPDESSIDITLHGTTPATIIDIPGDLYFSPEVVQTIDACSTLKPYPISNNGICPLTITDVSINPASENSGDYGLDGLPSFPIILQTGHIAGEGDLDVVFAPNEPLDRDKLGILSVTYVSDSVMGTTTTVDSNLCGEAVLTGARVLVTYGGSPVDVVERIQIQRINANRNRRPQLDTVSVLQNVPLKEYIPSGDPEYSACRGFRYHSEYGTVSNPLQLLPGVYQVNATIRVNGRRYTKSVGFSVNACDFNPTVVVTFPF